MTWAAISWVMMSGVLAGAAFGHVPIFSDGSATGPEPAVQVEDVTISRVVYHEVTDAAAQVWVTFEGRAGLEVPFRLGVPLIDRLRDFRPVLAVLGPGLPPVDLPFAIPPGSGGVLLEADPGSELEIFHEPFTGTDSWLIGDLDLTLPADGRYYVVAHVPEGQTGKLWVALGDREVFGADDIANLPATINRVRAFHEIPQSAVPCFVPLVGAVALTALWIRFHRDRSARVRMDRSQSCSQSLLGERRSS